MSVVRAARTTAILSVIVIGGCAPAPPAKRPVTSNRPAPQRSADKQDSSADDACTVEFNAQVLKCGYLLEFSGTVLVAAVDPSFVVTLRVLEDVPVLEWRYGDERHLAIHSLVETFGGESPVDQRYQFKLYGRDKPGERRHFYYVETTPYSDSAESKP